MPGAKQNQFGTLGNHALEIGHGKNIHSPSPVLDFLSREQQKTLRPAFAIDGYAVAVAGTYDEFGGASVFRKLHGGV